MKILSLALQVPVTSLYNLVRKNPQSKSHPHSKLTFLSQQITKKIKSRILSICEVQLNPTVQLGKSFL